MFSTFKIFPMPRVQPSRKSRQSPGFTYSGLNLNLNRTVARWPSRIVESLHSASFGTKSGSALLESAADGVGVNNDDVTDNRGATAAAADVAGAQGGVVDVQRRHATRRVESSNHKRIKIWKGGAAIEEEIRLACGL